MISLHNAVSKIYNTKWTLTTNFAVFLEPTDKSRQLWNACKLPNDDISFYIKDFKLPQCGSGMPIEKFINNRYRMASGIFDPVVIDLTFKDYDSFTLYRAFLKFLYETRYKYPEEYLINMKVLKLKDYQNGDESFEVMTFEKCIIKNVSMVTLSNDTESQIAEFSVTWKTSDTPKIRFK